LELQMVTSDEAVDRIGAVAGIANSQLTVQKTIRLRTQPHFHRQRVLARKARDLAGSKRGSVKTGGGRAGHGTAARTRIADCYSSISDDSELALSEVLSIQIEVDRINT